jgi:hypothetical protein
MKYKSSLLVLAGALVGGLLGHFIFFWVIRQGFYGLIIPGAAVGLGAGFFTARSTPPTILCGSWALALGLFTEWRYAPFTQDHSLGYFLSHLPDLEPITLIMVTVGAFLGFWIPFGRVRKGRKIAP